MTLKMGAKLVSLPVWGPMAGFLWIVKKLAEHADRELYDPERLQAQLVDLQLSYELGEIDEDSYWDAEEALLERLQVARERDG